MSFCRNTPAVQGSVLLRQENYRTQETVKATITDWCERTSPITNAGTARSLRFMMNQITLKGARRYDIVFRSVWIDEVQ